ncbi:peptidoglycan L-alanyl-D-glutamate endopeptidase CwlK [Sphingomonas aurantiaca]|uniref:Peptidoglycan L-alanyl-D-glutamate endopeptidase CwlK n=1 Tax=Sphingomonas aurantiaca TaxID=185949 RepID=A0A2T5GJ47_9SPHN|nr:M15 family metallopeptidase [Sphingomonas aurantiaca]PTQ59350.1 peptidoglycan L-alanyl-D-glutamate endopeptidase CwlK [Sphingomonas aurantiaca]
MSKVLGKVAILYLQRTCACSGCYSDPIDGKWSAAVEAAEDRLHERAIALQAELGSYDPRTERAIATLIVPAQRVARQFMRVATEFPHSIRIISGTRTYAEQDALYAIGRTTQLNRSPVTNAKAGRSNHNFGIAWDIGIFSADGRYMTGATKADVTAYRNLAAMVKAKLPAIEWGGDWKTFPDAPHYQLRTGLSVAETRARFEAGKALG